MSSNSQQAAETLTERNTGSTTRSLLLLATLFFMWGFITSMNDVLIPYLKGVFELTHFQSMQVQLAFFGAFFIGSLIYFVISANYGDPIARMGYQRGAVFGLLIAGGGALLFYPASTGASYTLFLTGLFTMGLGITLLQISANPYVIAIGAESTASSRLNLCQGVNSLGTTLGPLIGGALILRLLGAEGAEPESGVNAEAVRGPYLVFAGLLIALAVFFSQAKLPRILPPGTVQRGAAVLRKPSVLLGMFAIFCYVGAEVCIGSIMIDFFGLEEIAGLEKGVASAYVALYWGGLMIGRFLGAILLSSLSMRSTLIAMLAVPAAGFFLLAYMFSLSQELSYLETIELIQPFALLLILNVGAFALGAARPARTIGVFAVCSVALLVAAILQGGEIAFWSVIAVGLFNSIMWSNIFALTIQGLGKLQSQASSLLVMAIVGGALLPLAQGWVADDFGMRVSFIVPVIAYLYITFYGLWGHSLGRGETLSTAEGAQA